MRDYTDADDERDQDDEPQPADGRLRKYKQYSDQDIANALAVVDANNGNVYAAAKQTGIADTTLRQWVRGQCRPISAELREVSKQVLADQCESLAWKFLAVAEEKKDSMSAAQAVLAAGVLIDKLPGLRGEATSIVEHRDDSRTEELRRRYSAVIVVDAETTPKQPAPEPLPEPSENAVNPSVSSEPGPTPSE